MSVHTIPVPLGWSVEQAWTVIQREGKLPESTQSGPLSWANVVVDDAGKLVEEAPSKEVRPLRAALVGCGLTAEDKRELLALLADVRALLQRGEQGRVDLIRVEDGIETLRESGAEASLEQAQLDWWVNRLKDASVYLDMADRRLIAQMLRSVCM